MSKKCRSHNTTTSRWNKYEYGVLGLRGKLPILACKVFGFRRGLLDIEYIPDGNVPTENFISVETSKSIPQFFLEEHGIGPHIERTLKLYLLTHTGNQSD